MEVKTNRELEDLQQPDLSDKTPPAEPDDYPVHYQIGPPYTVLVD